jgi:hypothetical protein
LIVCGLVTFVVFLGHPASDRWSESGKLIGATLFQVGAVSLILELVHLDRLLGTKVPEALLDHGYLEGLRDERLDRLIERAIHARFPGIADSDVQLGRRWLLESLSARAGATTPSAWPSSGTSRSWSRSPPGTGRGRTRSASRSPTSTSPT